MRKHNSTRFPEQAPCNGKDKGTKDKQMACLKKRGKIDAKWHVKAKVKSHSHVSLCPWRGVPPWSMLHAIMAKVWRSPISSRMHQVLPLRSAQSTAVEFQRVFYAPPDNQENTCDER